MTHYLLAELCDGGDLEKAVFEASAKVTETTGYAIGTMIIMHFGRRVMDWSIEGLRNLDKDVHYWLQGLYPAGWHDDKANQYLPLPEDTWLDVMSLAAWKDPALRAEALAEFRAPDPGGEHHPSMCKAWRMACRIRTEMVLDE